MFPDASRVQPPSRWIVAAAGALLALAWISTHLPQLLSGEDTLIRFSLCALFAVLLFRRSRTQPEALPVATRRVVLVALTGLACAAGGILVPLHQFEWSGILLILLACLWWCLPGRFSRDAARALFLLYWAHPLPGQLFGPMQLAMQTASVQGAEWFLHLFDIPAWGDGTILRNGACLFDVPAWCSGMRSATTVLLLGLGLGLIRRTRWYALLILLAAALLQALGLNILRLAVMVQWAPSMPDPAAVGFLHDTAGILVLLTSLLLVFELWLWDRARAYWLLRAREPDVEAEVARRGRPPFWATVNHHRWNALAILLMLSLVAAVLFQSRPGHRLAMLKNAVDNLQRGFQVEPALRLAEEILRTTPDDPDWLPIVLRLQVQNGDYERVLVRLESMSDASPALADEKRMIKAYCLMGLGRVSEAAALVREIPSDPDKPDPRTAMILAELARQSDEPDRVAAYVAIASRWSPNLPRIRKLYPYLRQYHKWDAIADTDVRIAYHDPAQILCAAEAGMNLGHPVDVAALAEEALRKWPHDPRILEPLFYMTAKQPDTYWEGRFETTLRDCLTTLDNPDTLFSLFEKCFGLGRADLAWQVYDRLALIDPGHPGLPLCVARYGSEWFTFRTRHLGLSAAQSEHMTDLYPLLLLGRATSPWCDLWRRIPRAGEFAVQEPSVVRKHALDEALAAFRQRAAEGKLTLPMQYAFAEALDLAGDVTGATQQLARTSAAFPREILHTTLVLTELHERRGHWEALYEILRPWADKPELPLPLWLRLGRAEQHLNLGLEALDASRRAVDSYPYSTEALYLRASCLLTYDSPAAALFFLNRPRVRHDPELDLIEAELLFLTSRNTELLRFVEQAMLPGINAANLPPQPLFLPPAELAVLWHRIAIPSDKEFQKAADQLRENLKTARSPYLRDLAGLWLATEAEAAHSLDLPRWQACGRDVREKATALNQLCLLQCHRGNLAGAREAALAATRTWPGSPMLWRIAISLSGADPEVIRSARQACPGDAELWLAEIVARSQQDAGGSATNSAFAAWVERELQRVASAKTFPPDAVTRAGEYLARGHLFRPASIAARDASSRGRGLLPASLLAVHCALNTGDREWALSSARQASLESLESLPILPRVVAGIRGGMKEAPLDEEMVMTLKQLRRQEPTKALWSEMLCYVLFHRDNWTETMRCLSEAKAAIEAGSTKHSMVLLGAEAARQMRLPDQAAALLRQGLTNFPGDLAILNNLVYTLAQESNTLQEALALVPDLARQAPKNPQVIDTLTFTWIAAGKVREAESWLTQLEALPPGDDGWRLHVLLERASLAALKGEREEARRLARQLLADKRKATPQDVISAESLLGRLAAPGAKP